MGVVFGRDRELALGSAFVADAAERFAALVLEGEPGVGKTTVFEAVVHDAEAKNFLVLTCRPAETEMKYALSALADLLEPVAEHEMRSLPTVQRRALDAALLRSDRIGATAQPRTLATAVRSLLRDLSTEQRLLVAVDDVQWLDRASADVLEFVLRRSTAGGWLFARRLGEQSRVVPERLLPPDAVTVTSIGPLTVAALHHVLKDRLDQALTRSALVRVHGISGGNPFYALEIGREIARAGSSAGATMPVPESVREILSRRLRRLPAGTRDALLVASALSDPTIVLVNEEELRPAEEDDIVSIDEDGRIVFRHPLYASAVYGSASRARRRAAHLGLAGRVTDPEERARHLAASTTEPSEEIALALVDGADLARSRGAWGSAAELLEQAAALTPTDDERTSRGLAAAAHHIRAGDRSRARELLEALLARPLPRPLRADALRLLAEVSYNDENIIEAVRLFNEALEHADDPRVANTIELGLAYVQAQLYDFFGSAPHAHRAMERAEAAPDHPLLAESLGYCAMFDYLCGKGVDWDKIDRALELEDDDSLLPVPWRPSTLAGLLCAYVGRHDEARERLHAVWASAVERGDESDVAFVALWLSWLEARTGDLSAATVLVEQASAFADATGGQSTEAWTLAQRAYLHALRGDVADTRRACEDASVALGRFEHVLARIWLAASLGLLELSLGNAEAAWRACEPLVMALEAHGIPEPVPAFFLPDALEALIALGHLDRAETLLDAFEERGRALDRAWALSTGARCRALLLAARGEVASAAAEVEHALAEHERIEIPFELGRTLLVAGIIQRRQRQRGRAMASFRQAHELFARAGTRLWTERALAEIDRVGVRRSDGVTLTPSERRVAELAAKGMSNREVAGALSVSPKTVEANLGRVYRKLAISSRAELGAHMAKSLQE